ncbi:MAG TPA: MBL fold metallo-hydrolase [Rhizomicrobium sp.]|nr:MBL fold metallo-hydrolase [Rhizomicrobium sp.]
MTLRSSAPFAFTALLATVGATAQTAPDSIDAHLEAAKQAAGVDFKGTLGALCLPNPPRAAAAAARGPAATPARATWYARPYQVFDNLYFVGTKIHSSWALKTSDGIILIDTLFNYAAEPEIIDGLKTLGLDPATIKYVILTHGHGDHDQGVRLLQDRYHPHVVVSAQDWDLMENGPDMPGGKPKRDMVGTDGEKITLGDTTVTLVFTPGHTTGTFSLLFPVKDHGKTMVVAYSGGTLTGNFGADGARYDEYIASQKKFAQAAAKAGATVLMSNHSEYDNAYTKARLVATRQPGDPHPSDVGADGVQRYFKVMEECTEAMKLRALMPAGARRS